MGCIAGRESIEKCHKFNCHKFNSLQLTGGEWEHVQIFEKILAVCAHLNF